MYNVVQILGSLLILLAFAAALTGRLEQSGYRYLTANALGSAILAATAIISREWGFLLLEGVWALVSLYSILRNATGHPLTAPHQRPWTSRMPTASAAARR